MAQFVRDPKMSVDTNDSQVLVRRSMSVRCDEEQHLVEGGEEEEVPSKRLVLMERLCIQGVCDEGNIQHAEVDWVMVNGMDVSVRR